MHHMYTQNHVGLLIVTCIKSRSISHESVELLQARVNAKWKRLIVRCMEIGGVQQ
jgi:hypothetical protein